MAGKTKLFGTATHKPFNFEIDVDELNGGGYIGVGGLSDAELRIAFQGVCAFPNRIGKRVVGVNNRSHSKEKR